MIEKGHWPRRSSNQLQGSSSRKTLAHASSLRDPLLTILMPLSVIKSQCYMITLYILGSTSPTFSLPSHRCAGNRLLDGIIHNGCFRTPPYRCSQVGTAISWSEVCICSKLTMYANNRAAKYHVQYASSYQCRLLQTHMMRRSGLCHAPPRVRKDILS